MFRTYRRSPALWLATGLLAGLCISYFWPSQQVKATTSDRDDKFAMVTMPVTIAAVPGAELEGVFVLDFLTGQLRGAVLNQKTGTFTHHYMHNVAADFQAGTEARYAFVSGIANLPNRGRLTMGTGVLYIAELTSGKVLAYGLSYADTNRPVPPQPLLPLDGFQFRQPVGQ